MKNTWVLVRRACNFLLVTLCYAAFYLEEVECQTRKRPKSRMERGGARNSRLPVEGDNAAVTTGIKLLAYLLLAIFLPPILIFVYNLYKDPLTMTVIKDGLEVLKHKTIGSLSKKKDT